MGSRLNILIFEDASLIPGVAWPRRLEFEEAIYCITARGFGGSESSRAMGIEPGFWKSEHYNSRHPMIGVTIAIVPLMRFYSRLGGNAGSHEVTSGTRTSRRCSLNGRKTFPQGSAKKTQLIASTKRERRYITAL